MGDDKRKMAKWREIMSINHLHEFCTRWLAAWSGNRPDTLIEYYSNDIYYRDPVKSEGLQGKDQLFAYFKKLLAKNVNWVWKPKEIIPTENGFVLKWIANIPTESSLVTVEGLDIVELQGMKITRNEVYFDRSILLNPSKVKE